MIRLLLAGVHAPLKHGSIEGVGKTLSLPFIKVSGHGAQPGLVGLSVLGAAETALVGTGTGAGGAAPAVTLGRQVTDTLTAKLREVAGEALIVHDGARLAAAHVLNLVSVELRGSVVEADGPAARLVVEHTTVEIDLGDLISTGATEVRGNSTKLESTQWVVTCHVRDTDGGHAGARGGVVQLKRIFPHVEVLALQLTVAGIKPDSGKLGAVLQGKNILVLGLDTVVTAVVLLLAVVCRKWCRMV